MTWPGDFSISLNVDGRTETWLNAAPPNQSITGKSCPFIFRIDTLTA